MSERAEDRYIEEFGIVGEDETER